MSTSLLLLGSALTSVCVYYVITALRWLLPWCVRYVRVLRTIRGYPRDPITSVLGNLPQFPGPDERGLAFQRGLVERHAHFCTFFAAHLPLVIVHHPDTVKVLLKSSEPKNVFIYEFARPWVGDGLLTSNGRKWARNRRLLTPAFHFEILKNYMSTKNRCADLLVEKFDRAADSGNRLMVFGEVTLFTLDVILRCAMSYTSGCQESGSDHPYVTAVNHMSTLVLQRSLQPWFIPDFIYFLSPGGRKMLKYCNVVHKVASDVIEQRKQSLRDQGESAGSITATKYKCMDFLDILLTAKDDEGHGLTEQEIRDEVDTFLFEGHDTTASAISWTLYSIAGHPEVQRRLQAELDAVYTGRTGEDVLWEDLTELPYLTQVIKEGMRLHSPVPFIMRRLARDIQLEGRMIPEGMGVAINIYAAHHNPAVWPDSLTFDPSRFDPEKVKARDSYAFVPFSAGPRNCIGQAFAMDEIKLVLARLLVKYTVRLDPNHVVEHEQGAVMRAKDDIAIFVEMRS